MKLTREILTALGFVCEGEYGDKKWINWKLDLHEYVPHCFSFDMGRIYFEVDTLEELYTLWKVIKADEEKPLPMVIEDECNMKKEDYLKCIVSVINFLVLHRDEFEEQKNFNTESNISMTKILKKYGYSMTSFAEHLSGNTLWDKSPTEFFSNNEKCLSYFISKLNEYNKK